MITLAFSFNQNVDVTILSDNPKFYGTLINLFNSGIRDSLIIFNNVLFTLIPTALTISSSFGYEMVNTSVSSDFMCGRFFEYTQRVLNYAINHSNRIGNIDICRNTGYMANYLNYYNYLLYLFYYHFKSHLAYYLILIYILIQHLISNISSNISFNRFSLYLYLLILQSKPVLGANLDLVNKLIVALGWFSYINLMALYDIVYKNIKHKHMSNTLFLNGRISYRFIKERLILGSIFLFTINNGILFSNSFYNVTIPFLSSRNKIIAIVCSYIVSTISSTGWLYFTRRDLLGYSLRSIIISYIRSIFESFAFNALSYANYIIWSLLPQIYITSLLAFIIGILCYLLFSCFQVYMETNLDYSFLYGLLYNLVFTSLSVSSSGLYLLMNIANMSIPTQLVLMVLCMLNLISFPLEIYRFTRPNVMLGQNNNNTLIGHLLGTRFFNNYIVIYIISILYQLIVFFSFAFGTFIWLSLVGLTI